MADVKNLLKQILSAVYGKDVRRSIHDAIEQCYKDASSGGVEVTNTEPVNDSTCIWINPDKTETFFVAEVIDDQIRDHDTWSSKKISMLNETPGIRWNNGTYVNGNGIIIDNASPRMSTNLVPCYGGIEVTFMGETAHTNVSGITFYDAEGKIIQLNCNLGPNGEEYTVTSPENARFLRLSSAEHIGWNLKFSEVPLYEHLAELNSRNANFETNVDYRIAYDQIINGVSQTPSAINPGSATVNDDGSITVAPGGWYFVSFPYGSFGGNAYVSVDYDRDERIKVMFSYNGTTSLESPYVFTSKKINGREIIKIDKLKDYAEYPYAVVRIDNRGKSDSITISEIKIVDGDKPLPSRPFYVSVDGSDENTGALDSPFATVNRALTVGASDIYVKPGVYEQTINLGNSHHCNVSISSYQPDGRVIFRDIDSVISTTEDQVSGYTKVYRVNTDREFSSRNIWIFQDGIPDESTLIDTTERHALQRGYEYRCEDTKISRCTNTALGDALDEIESSSEYKWFFDESTSTIYFSRPQAITSTNPLCGSTANTLFKSLNRNITLNISGIETKYMMFNVNKTTNSTIKDCKSANACGAGAFIYDEALGCEFVRCEATRCFTGSNGDGFNAHADKTGDPHARQVTVSLIDCWSHDNNDDGYSDHERSEITIIGGLFEYNGKGGVTPSYGSHCTCYDVYSRKNYCGFYYTGTVEETEGGVGGQMYCYNCIAEENNRGGTNTGFRVDGAYNRIVLIGCKSINNNNGYVIGNDLSTGKLIDCSEFGNVVKKSGHFEIENTTLVG